MGFKLSIGGTFSSGKTTLSYQLFRHIQDTALLPEHSWDMKNLFPDINWSSQLVRDYMLLSQIVREKSIEQPEHNIIICDSGILESLAHSLVFRLDTRVELIKQFNHRRYDLVFLCDYRDVPLEDNHVRYTDPILRANLHSAIVSIAGELGYKPIILTGDPQKRLRQVLRVLEDNQNTP